MLEECQEILEFIRNRWDETVRTNTEDEGNLIGLPYPYTVPCAKGRFQELYYWDTYFACRGLLMQGFLGQVKNNCDDFIYEVERFGFIPNGSRTYYLNRSQPPYFGLLVDLVYGETQDKEWLAKALTALEKECEFWRTTRRFSMGLYHYGHHVADDEYREFMLQNSGLCTGRIGMKNKMTEDELIVATSHTIAEAESGWDFTPRFDRVCMDYAPIDLNCLIYQSLMVLAELYLDLGEVAKAAEYRSEAKRLAELINQHCWSEERQVFLDYNPHTKKHSSIFSAASLHPLWAGFATEEQAASTVMLMEELLETAHGLLTCEYNETDLNYQWNFPNGWAPLHMIAIDGLDAYGYPEAASRIAEKYIATATTCYEQTGDLWEKYNVVNGSTEVQDNGGMPAMMGWTAAAFIVACDYLSRNNA